MGSESSTVTDTSQCYILYLTFIRYVSSSFPGTTNCKFYQSVFAIPTIIRIVFNPLPTNDVYIRPQGDHSATQDIIMVGKGLRSVRELRTP